jgi:hypothetical protein
MQSVFNWSKYTMKIKTRFLTVMEREEKNYGRRHLSVSGSYVITACG